MPRTATAGMLLCLLAWGADAQAADSPYWLRLDDLRLPRPRQDEGDRPAAKVPEKTTESRKQPAPAEPADGTTAPTPQATEEQAPSAFRFGGSYRLLAIASRTPPATGEDRDYTQLANRLRMKLSYSFSPTLQARLEHDTELTTGNYLHTRYFEAQRQTPASQFWSSGSVWADRRDAYGTQRVFRAQIKKSSDLADVTLGRQRIPLGTGRFWSALDMLNPINPLQVERDEFTGVDAVLVERNVGALSRASLAYAPDPAKAHDRVVGQYRSHVGQSDLTFTFGKYWLDRVAGIDFATQLGNAGVRGEVAYTRPEVGAPFRKAVLGIDYVFPNTLSVSAEAYYSDRSDSDRMAQWQRNPQLRMAQPPGRRYFGIAVGYEITPLLKFSTYVIAGLSDKSSVFYPVLSYAASNEINLLGGAQFFSGARDSEYGGAGNLYFMRLQRFF